MKNIEKIRLIKENFKHITNTISEFYKKHTKLSLNLDLIQFGCINIIATFASHLKKMIQ